MKTRNSKLETLNTKLETMSITATIPGGAVQLSGNPVLIETAGASIPSGATEYMTLLKIINDDAVLIGAPFTMAIAPDGDGEAVFDISGYVDQPVDALWQWPVSGVAVQYALRAFNITVQPGERYIDSNGALQTNWFAESSEFQILKGGLSPRQVAALRDGGSNFYTRYIQGGKFLTSRPSSEEVHPLQPVKLWLMIDYSLTPYVKVSAHYDDGTDDEASTSVTITSDALVEINCNPATHGLALEPTGKRMVHYDVWIEHYGNKITEVRRFVIDWRYCERPVFMMFANTFGGVDDVYLSGYMRDSFATEGDIASRQPQITDTVFTPTLLSLNKQGQNHWAVNSGWKSLTTIQYYRDLFISKQAWLLYTNVSQTTTSVVPVIIDTADRLLFDRQTDMYSIDVEFSEAHKSRHSFDNRIF